MDDQTQQAQFVPQDDQGGMPVSITPDPDEAQAVTVEPEEQTAVEVSAEPEVPSPAATTDEVKAPSQPAEQMSDQSIPYDEEIKSDKIETKRKTFFLDLKANSMGRYVKISERSSGKRSTIIIPEENVAEFVDKLHGLFTTDVPK
ncbi:MAG: hypothetical protein UT11_C0010G0014 [Berkelbacteria bacterium GW2011_GWA2_38_9]|uniref:Uncharacterized protein n=1 Tax=Berkelbacteria bacterium GW2011_GWA2_38_9 TaxID=1618334 RepID=A0A0G0LGQ8_9BACT|nr:MAG: hypothetical protein UT11_C0010G0014 [Berkelbacteria bacterium GW2011_GWA2_38_9]